MSGLIHFVLFVPLKNVAYTEDALSIVQEEVRAESWHNQQVEFLMAELAGHDVVVGVGSSRSESRSGTYIEAQCERIVAFDA